VAQNYGQLAVIVVWHSSIKKSAIPPAARPPTRKTWSCPGAIAPGTASREVINVSAILL